MTFRGPQWIVTGGLFDGTYEIYSKDTEAKWGAVM